jgi:hypothetical protein
VRVRVCWRYNSLSWNDTTIEKCNYNGTVTGTYCGGITGQATHWCLIIDCYSTGIVSGDNALEE